MKNIQFKGIEFETVNEAIQAIDADGLEAIQVGGRYFAVKEAEAERIAAAGVSFAYLGVIMRSDGREVVCTIPVN